MTGFWKVSYEVPHGKVHYETLDHEAFTMKLHTVPAEACVNEKEKYDLAELKQVIQDHSNTIFIDLKDATTLRHAKDELEADFVMANIPLNSNLENSAARFVIWHIRAYRKIFVKYYQSACDLWQGSGLHSATSLIERIKENINKEG
jgi:hypothetical protein